MTTAIPVGQLTTIRRQRVLPVPGRILVEPGQLLQPSSLVARAELPGAAVSVSVASKLSVEPDHIQRYMLKQVGDQVRPGEPLAASSGWFGVGKEQVLAPRGGTIESISPRNGMVVIREPVIPIERTAYFPGRVVEIIPEQGVVVEGTVQVFSGAFGVGGERFGRLLVLGNQPNTPLAPELITSEARGGVLLVGSGVSADCLRRAAQLGVAGIITGSLRSSDLAAYLGYEIGIPITGQENVVSALILTEGFGDVPMNSSLYNAIEASAGRIVSINGTTHLRSQLLRPEIIVPSA